MSDLTDPDLLQALQSRLIGRGETLACAESLTGGRLASLLSQTPGASAVFLGGVVSYATEVKRQVLGVRAPRVISAECAVQMADGVRRLLGADWGIATTGVAGPTEQEGMPVGTVHIAVVGPQGARAEAYLFTGDRLQIRDAACREALELLVHESTVSPN